MRAQITIPIAGMSCDRCVEAIRTALAEVGGIDDIRVKVGAATVRYDASRKTPLDLVRAIERAGYRAVPSNSASYAGAGRRTCCRG